VQIIILATFVGIFGIVVGVYWALVLRDESRTSTRIRKRLRNPFGSTGARRFDLARKEQALSSVGVLNKGLLRVTSLTAPVQRLIQQADSEMSVGLFCLMSGSAAIAGYLAMSMLTGYRGIGLLIGALVAFGPYMYLLWRRSRRMMAFEEKFPEALDLIARALRAGHAFTSGLSMAADEMPDPIGPEFRLLYERQNFGMPMSDALRGFAERVPLLDARFFATAVLTQREAGGNLSEVLDNLAKVVRERFKVKRQIRVVSAHARMTGGVLVALPPAMAVALVFLSPENTKLLVTDPMGVKMVIGAAVLQILGGLTVKKLVNIEY
jgi:tight adherence protein B